MHTPRFCGAPENFFVLFFKELKENRKAGAFSFFCFSLRGFLIS
jgi:hypothetical protein|tara:strand:- start:1584 stop:1715 length:132 start_codon:yes stop_codon:yes gene_type:complete